ncbi:RNA polymerase factor sigma-32 [Polyangium spumosum]|uniref:RNA polymerase factor sigma-32 n=1 Tax=Polyangium spumosum TaxID=889282 RepID=UPI0030845B39
MATKKTEPGKKTTRASAGGATKRGKRTDASAAAKAERRASDADPAEAAEGGGDDEGHAAESEGSDVEVIEVEGEVVDEDVDAGSFDKLPLAPRKAAAPKSDAALSRTDPLQAYLREVQRHPLLTPEEEQKLTRHYVETQDVKTAARLVTANLRLVVKLAYEYRRAYKNIMDLIQEGNIGLMQAVKRYDPYRGVKLSSYAAWWIRAYILRFILNNWRLVKLGTTQAQRKLFFNLNKEKARLAAMGIEPTAAEIARRLSVDESEVVDMDRRLSSGEASLDAPVGDSEGRSVSRIDLMPSYTTGPDAAYESQEMDEMVRERLSKFRETLKGKDIIIFDKRMAAEDPLTLQELGDEFGISRERVRQLEARLTMKLREYLKEELGDAVGGAR